MLRPVHCVLAALLATCFACLATANDRQAEFDSLVADFKAANDSYVKQHANGEIPAAEQISRYEAYPLWRFLPKFVALAEANSDDATTLKACQWIVDACGRRANAEIPIFEAERTAWQLIAAHHAKSDDIALLCLEAVLYQSPAREAFLRAMAKRTDLPGDAEAFALVALAEYLGHRYEFAEKGGLSSWREPEDEFDKYLRSRIAPEWMAYAAKADADAARTESIALFHEVLDKYGETPFKLTAPYFRNLETIEQKARKSLHALEHLYVGAPAPEFAAKDLDGHAVRMADYHGKAVLLSFWFTGCGPCVAMVPKEKELVEKYRGKPFAILGVCRDEDAAIGKKTAAEHDMTWPSLHDGPPSPVIDAYNILGFPSFYLIDAEGKIAAKDASWEKIDGEVAKLIEQAAKHR